MANDFKIELVVDHGEVAADNQSMLVCEVELELKHGTPANLFTIARQLDAAAAVRPGVLTKAERGYRLLGRQGSDAAKAEPITLEPTMTAATAFQVIAWSCVRHFRLNETASIEDTAALHQARVGLRRLRSALSLFKPVVEDGCFDRLRGELRWLSSVLGEARDIDVVIERTHDAALLERLRDARATAGRGVELALASPRSRSLMLDLAEWLTLGDWLVGPATDRRRDRSIDRFARDCLKRFRRRLKR